MSGWDTPWETPTVVDNYTLHHKLGSGSFGEIWLARKVDGQLVAVKLEKHTSHKMQLPHEYKVYQVLRSEVGFPRIKHFSKHENYNIMEMDCLGLSLEKLFVKCGRKFSLKTILMITEQLLQRVEYVHSRLLIHRDISMFELVISY